MTSIKENLVIARTVEPCSSSLYDFSNVGCYFSVSKFIRLGVSDKNEHAPYFEKGVFEVDIEENKEANNPVLTVAAKDRKDCK